MEFPFMFSIHIVYLLFSRYVITNGEQYICVMFLIYFVELLQQS